MTEVQIQEKINIYCNELKKFNEITNVYSKNAYNQLSFHIEDSRHMSKFIPNGARTLVDMGSGSGLPSVILAICNPSIMVTAVESKSRKRKFLHFIGKLLKLDNFIVYDGDIQSYLANTDTHIDVFTAKAFAPISKINKILRPIRNTHYKLIIPYSYNQYQNHDKDHEKQTYTSKDSTTFYYMVKEHNPNRT